MKTGNPPSNPRGVGIDEPLVTETTFMGVLPEMDRLGKLTFHLPILRVQNSRSPNFLLEDKKISPKAC